MEHYTLNRLEYRLGQVERCGDVVDAVTSVVPPINIVSGCSRIAAGKVQVIVALVTIVFAEIAYIFSEDSYCKSLSNRMWDHVTHGFGNIIHGCFQLIPLVGLVFYLRSPTDRMKYDGELHYRTL